MAFGVEVDEALAEACCFFLPNSREKNPIFAEKGKSVKIQENANEQKPSTYSFYSGGREWGRTM